METYTVNLFKEDVTELLRLENECQLKADAAFHTKIRNEYSNNLDYILCTLIAIRIKSLHERIESLNHLI